MSRIFDNIKGFFTYPQLYKDMIGNFPAGSTFVEVGSYYGKSLAYLIEESQSILKPFNIFAVDSFVGIDGGKDVDAQQINIFNENMKPLKDKFTLIVGDSAQSANAFKDKSVDFVFIDADHHYKSVKKDILAWLPKVKEGGVIAGHDYSSSYCGVIEAVNEIFGNKVNYDYLYISCWLVNL